MTRRSFLVASASSGLSVSLDKVAFAQSNEMDDADLSFEISKDRTRVRVSIIQEDPAIEDKARRLSSRRIMNMYWDIDAHWFGPEAQFVLYSPRKATDPIYRLSLEKVRYGQDKNREVAFDFWLENNADGRLRWVLNGWSTLWSPNTSPSLFSLNATGDTKDKLDFRAFIQGKAQLEAWPKFARLQNTFRRIWTGLIKTEEPSERSKPKLRFHARGEWTVEKISESAPDFLTAGVNQLKVERISLRWCFDSQTGRPHFVDEFASAVHAKKTELEVYCDSHSQNADAAVVGWAPLPATGTIMLGKKARNLKLNFDRALSNAEAGRTSFDQQLVVRTVDRPVQRIGETPRLWSELAFFGSWKISVASSEGVTGPFDDLHGRFLRRTSFAQDGSGRIDSEVTLDLRWSNTDKIRRLRTPFCGMGINGVITEAESDRKGDAFRNLGGYPVRAALASKGTGLEIAMALRHFDVTAELREADFSLPDAHYSRLDFDSSEIRFVLSDETFDAPAGNSFVRLDAPKNDPVPVRLDLRRARLYAARIDSLASLKFRFNGLALELSRSGLEIVTNSTQCGTWNEPSFPADAATADGRHIQRADPSKAIVESRPLLVVEFPPQHVMEEAFFLPGLPKLPNVKSKTDKYVKGEKQDGTYVLQKVQQDSHKPEITENSFIIDVNDDDAISVVLTRLKTTDERSEFRRIVSDLKYDRPEDPERQAAKTFRDFRDKFEKEISKNNGALSRKLPKDQKIYIGPIALDPDVRILARSVQQKLLDKSIDAILANLLDEVKTQAEKLLEEPGPEIKNHANDLASALALEGVLESAVPSYQAFRSAYRDFMLDLITDEGKYELGSYYLEYVIELSGNRAWILDSDRSHPLNNEDYKKKFRKLYVEILKGRDTPSGIAEARLSQPSRLAFRVNCRDGLAAARSQVAALDALQDSQLGLGQNRLGFTLRDLTNWSSMELSVVRRAANVYATGIGGRLDARSGRRLDFSEEGRLDALGFTSGDMVTAATRLAEVQRSMQDPPGSFETSIEIPSRLQLSTNDSAVFLTQQPVPAEIFSSTQENRGSGEITDSRRLNGTMPLWSARLVTDGLDAGLRAVHSPDFRPDFVWTALADLQGDSLEYTGSGDTKEKAVSRMPGVGAPPQGPIAPWLIGLEETTGRPADALKLFRAGMSEGAGAYFDLSAEERAFCHAVLDPAKQIERPKGLVPKIVDFLCRRGHFTKGWWQDANDLDFYRKLRRFRTALSANDRHQLVVLSSAHGLPVVGRRGLDGELVAGSSQVDVEQRYQLADVLPGSALYRAKTLDVSELMLTALGGSIRLDTSFEPPVGAFHINKKPLFDALSVERWQQWSVLGRDVFTEIVYKGFLLPFGHRASLVKVTERTFLRDEETGLIRAYLRQKMFIRCSKPEKRYPAIGQANGGRSFPADRLVILTVQTPDIIDPLTIEDHGSNSGEDDVRELSNGRLNLGARPGLAFWPRIALAKGAEVRFELDLNGTYSDLPMIFVDNVAMNDQKAMAALTRYYYSLKSPEDKDVPEQINPLIHRRTLRLSGEKIRYAPEIETGSASIETEAWTLELEGREDQPSDYPEKKSKAVEEYRFRNNNFLFSSVLQGADQPPLYPVVAATRIRLRQNERLTGSTGNPVRACFDGRYIDKGFPEPSSDEGGVQDQTSAARSVNNAAQIFLTLADQPEQNMGRKGDNTGGMFRPAGNIVAFSRSKGPVTRNTAIEEIKGYFRREPLTSDMDIIFRRPSLAAAYHTDEPKQTNGNGGGGEASAVAAAGNSARAETRQALENNVQEIYKSLFSTDAKILGLVRVQDLLSILASSGIAEDPATGIPQFVEKVRYGAGQAAQAAGDATGFVRDQVLKPLLSAVTDIRRRWDKIEADLADGQRVFDENNIEPIKLAEVFPELANGLAGLQSALLRSSAITDDIAFSLSLAEVYEAGQRFISALQATAANPIARIEDVVVDRVSQIRQFGPSIRKDLDKYTEVILKDLLPERKILDRVLTGEKEIIAVQLSLFLIPEKEDAEGKPFLQLPVPVPAFTSPPFDQIEEDDKKILEEISSKLHLSRSEVREVAKDLLERLLSGQEIEDILGDLSVIEDLQSNLEAKLEDAFDIAAEKFEEDAKKELRDEIFRILKEYEVFIASAEQLIAQLKPYYRRFARIKVNYDKLLIALRNRDALGAAQHALPIVEEVTGPLHVDLASVCHPDSVLVKAFDEAAQSVSLEKVSLCSVRFSNKDGEIEDARLCSVGNDNALDENYVGVGTGKVLEALEDWHEKLGSIRESLKKTSSSKLAGTFKEAKPLKIGDKKISDLDGFDETVARLQKVFEKTENTVVALHKQIAELHCLLINDTLRLNALEAEFQNSLKDIGNVCRIGSTPAQKVRRLQDHVNAFLLSRQELLKNLTERLSLSVDQIVSWLKNKDVQLAIGTAGLAGITAPQLGDVEGAKDAVTDKLNSVKNDVETWFEQFASSALDVLAPASEELADYAGNLAKTSESAAQKIKTIKEQVDVFGYIVRIDLQGLDNSLDSLRKIDGQLSEVAQNIKEKWEAVDQNSLSAVKALQLLAEKEAGRELVPLHFFVKLDIDTTPSVHVLNKLDREIEKFVADLATLFDRLISQAESEVLNKIDELALKSILRDFEDESKTTSTIEKLYEKLNTLKNDALKNTNVPVALRPALRQALMIAPRDDDFGHTVKVGADRLTRDVELLGFAREKLSSEEDNPTQKEAKKNKRRYLATFIREWQDGKSSTPLRIALNFKDVVVDLVKGQMFQQLLLAEVRDQIEQYLLSLIPAKIEMSYDFSTPLSAKVKDATFGIFEPEDGSAFTVETRLGIDLSQNFKPEVTFRSESRIGPFSINLVGDFKAVKLIFGGARFVTQSGAESRFDVKYVDYEIGEQLDFVQALQSFFTPRSGSGFFLMPTFAPIGIEAGYDLPLGTISIGNVSFFNVSISASARLPFEDADARFRGSLSRRLAPFTISAAPYGGSGFFAIEANTKGIVGFEAAFEYGGAGAFAFGPLNGQGRIMAGVYIRQSHIPNVGKVTEISGTFFAGGSASIWIFSFGSSFHVRLGMVNGDMSGEAVYTFSFSMGLKDLDISVPVWKKEEKNFSSSRQASLLDAPAGTRFAERIARSPLRLAGLGDAGYSSLVKTAGLPVVETKMVSPEQNWGEYRRYFDNTIDYQDEF
ncbi:hypothetical protein AB1P65_06280 [Roseibium alexandrii]